MFGPPASASQAQGSQACVTTSSVRGAANQTQNFVHARQAL